MIDGHCVDWKNVQLVHLGSEEVIVVSIVQQRPGRKPLVTN